MITLGLCLLGFAGVAYAGLRLWVQTRREEWDRRDMQISLALQRAEQERRREDRLARQPWTFPYRRSDWAG